MFLIDFFVMIRGELSDLFKYMRGYKYRKAFDAFKKQKKIYYMMTPTYGNLGDQAIEIATTKCLKKNFPEYKIIKIHLQDTGKYLRAVKRTIQKNDLIILQGGGNFGDVYASCERARRRIIKSIRNNYVISMPSSIHYLNSIKGKYELAKSRRIYNKRNMFICISRDVFSYEFAKMNFTGCRNILSPDIVFYLQEKNEEVVRETILLCLRTDQESAIKDNRNWLVNRLFAKYENSIIVDTQLYRSIEDECKEFEVESMLRVFRKARVVVTDRLHGLIFSVITNTPCVAIASKDRKIEGLYEWVKENNNMRFCQVEQLTEIEKDVNILLNCDSDNSFDISVKLDEVMCRISNIISNEEW